MSVIHMWIKSNSNQNLVVQNIDNYGHFYTKNCNTFIFLYNLTFLSFSPAVPHLDFSVFHVLEKDSEGNLSGETLRTSPGEHAKTYKRHTWKTVPFVKCCHLIKCFSCKRTDTKQSEGEGSDSVNTTSSLFMYSNRASYHWRAHDVQ